MWVDFITSERYSPYRRPDWRWRCAERLATSSRSRTVDLGCDEMIHNAVKYLETQFGGAVCGQTPAIHAARVLRDNGGSCRREIEVRLLARQAPADVAVVVDMDEDAVVAFEGLFFNIADRIHASDWIVAQVLAARTRPGIEGTADALLRQIAYFGGMRAAETALVYLSGDRSWMKSSSDLTMEQGRVTASLRRAISSVELLGRLDATTLAHLHAELCRVSRSRSRQTPTRHCLAQQSETILDELAATPLAQPRSAPRSRSRRQTG